MANTSKEFMAGKRIVFPAIFFAALAAGVSAQTELRLDDLFSSQTATIAHRPTTLEQIDAAAVPRMMTELEDQIATGNSKSALPTTELLLAWLDPKSDEYAHVLYLRARAYDALEDKTKLLAIADLYIKKFPEGADRGWFLVRTARMLKEDGRTADAAIFWKEIVEKNLSVSPAEGVEGAGILVAARDGKSARMLVDRLAQNAGLLDGATETRLANGRLASLLVQFDAAETIPEIPAGASARIRLMYAMALELANRRGDAEAAYRELVKAEDLDEAQRQIAWERQQALGRDVWRRE